MIKPASHGLAVDELTSDLYLIGGAGNLFAIYNLNSNKWTNKPEIFNEYILYPKAIIVPRFCDTDDVIIFFGYTFWSDPIYKY